jgi:hypothetical protein
MVVSIYKTVKDTSNPFNKPVQVALERIKNGASKEINLKIRSATSKDEQKALKSKLCGVCFNGTFVKRSIKGLEKKSGLIILDFDDFDTEQLAIDFKESLKEDAYIFAAWISPSGKGVKVLIKIPIEGEHKQYFNALQKHFNSENWDVSGSNIDRFCFESYDPDLFQNNDSLIWEFIELPEYNEIETYDVIIPIKSERIIIERLLKWWNAKYGIVKGKINDNLHILAKSFNTFGIPKSECEHVLKSMVGIEKDKEVQQLIDSAYKHVAEFNTKQFNDNSAKQKIEKQIISGAKTTEIIKLYPAFTAEEVETCIAKIKQNNNNENFWEYDEKGKCIISPHKYKFWLEDNNFFKYFPTETNTYTFIKKHQGLIEETNEKRIKDYVLTYLLNRNDIGFSPYDMMVSSTKNFTADYLACLESANIKLKEDTVDICYLYFKNKVIKVDKDNIEQIEYLNIQDYVWKKQVIDRDYIESDHHDSVFRKFVWLIAGQDTARYNTLKSVIGYLLHSFKTSANNRAVIFNDEVISDNPNGGSGKGLFCNALSKMKKISSIDGKNFEFTKSFPYQTVGTDTQLLVFDDVKKNFVFESLFSLITEGLTLEYKGQDAIKLPVSKSPKILITTNYTIGGVGGSFERRKFEVEFSSYFNSKYTPIDEFNHMFFDDWNESEWSRFDNYMIQCTKYYLQNGLVKNNFINLELKKLINETKKEFIDWATLETLPLNTRLPKDEIYNLLVKDYSDFSKWLRKNTLTKWLKTYAEYHKYKVLEGKTNNVYWIEFEAPKGTWENPIELNINE